MRKSTSPLRHALPVFAGALVLLMSACGPQGVAPTPTVDVTAIYTAAFQTFTAQQATQAALTPPTPVPSQTPLPTVGLPSTGATTSLPGTTSGTASTAQGCDNATYASDVTIPDGTVMAPGQSFVKTWGMKDSGSCPWTTGYKLVFLSGDAMSGTAVPITAAVQPQAIANLSVNLTAPTLPGNYTGTWRLQNATGAYFGDAITVVITVSGPGGTGGSTVPTATP